MAVEQGRIRQTFGPGPNQKHGYCGHQEIEIALIKLYRLTKERKYLDLATYFINERGKQPHYFDIERIEREKKGWEFQGYTQGNYEYSQSHKPVREQDKVVGILDESDVLMALATSADNAKRPVGDFMTSKLETVRPNATINDLLPIFRADRVAIVADETAFYGLITKIDLINYLRKQLP